MFVGIAAALGCGGLSWLLFTPWAFASEARQEAVLHELVAHYEPLVEGVHRYEEDHGWPPHRLEELVPNYLTTLPSLETDVVDQFSYFANFTTSIHVSGSSGGHIVWYVVGEQTPDERCTWPDGDWECARHSHLLFLLNEQDEVHSWRVLRATDLRQREQTRATLDDLFNRLEQIQTVGKAWSEVQSHFGTPRGDGEVDAYWSMVAWLPDFFFDLDADDFSYDSSDLMQGDAGKFGGWKLTRH